MRRRVFRSGFANCEGSNRERLLTVTSRRSGVEEEACGVRAPVSLGEAAAALLAAAGARTHATPSLMLDFAAVPAKASSSKTVYGARGRAQKPHAGTQAYDDVCAVDGETRQNAAPCAGQKTAETPVGQLESDDALVVYIDTGSEADTSEAALQGAGVAAAGRTGAATAAAPARPKNSQQQQQQQSGCGLAAQHLKSSACGSCS
ncbi:hypothetical protein cyc_07728 [Cyclospora cayetanensis]|uniref:Uncharacterized protein n=1 Tax=Cyclospora cayetanensis TaxID=88456 RepID=A0A1D3CQR8_9EIME|nr:hypothetical protein cyc_07728 [Cyclospora cayetanensis]